MNLQHWLQLIERLHIQEIDLGLSRILRVANRLKCRTFSHPVITIAGTNGKGSCVHCLESIYLAAGYRVGAYTSPHLHIFNERIRIQGQNIDDHSLISAFEAVEKARQEESLSFFEFTTLAALILFQQAKLDVLILEVGLGGRQDAVNIIDADLALITSIDLDHTDWLGENKEAIGFEKAGILRHQRPLVYGDIEVPETILQQVKVHQAPFYQLNHTFHYNPSLNPMMAHSNWSWRSQKQILNDLPPITIKQENAASSLMVVELLQSDLPVPAPAIHEGLRNIKIPGRFEFKNKPLPCIFDVAHNPQAGRWLATQLQKIPWQGQRIAIVGMLSDKDIMNTLAPLCHLIDRWHLANLEVTRGAKASQINQILSSIQVKNCYNYLSVSEAFKAALDISLSNTLIETQLVIFGSFYTVSAAQTYFNQLNIEDSQ